MDTEIAQLIVNGISLGSIIALSAVGLSLTYGIL
ncbi:MAG: branched-chain amino acid ABC transporter permease, partial [Phormidesmis sp. CAN_BIN44]|nr:branched-chain amino acid ABC transporter permease [Phormidesmis sp. CAN_BIN44]